jgi:hypothetical protein
VLNAEYTHSLTQIDVSVAASDLSCAKLEDAQERTDAARHLQEFCSDLHIEGFVHDASINLVCGDKPDARKNSGRNLGCC